MAEALERAMGAGTSTSDADLAPTAPGKGRRRQGQGRNKAAGAADDGGLQADVGEKRGREEGEGEQGRRGQRTRAPNKLYGDFVPLLD